MSIAKMCPPALLYLAFSLTHIVIDTFKGFYSTAFTKFIVMTIFTLILNIMCENGLSIISWIIVFLPFILMTYITAVLMYVFGLQPSSSHVESSTASSSNPSSSSSTSPKEDPTVDPHENDNQRHRPADVPDYSDTSSQSSQSESFKEGWKEWSNRACIEINGKCR